MPYDPLAINKAVLEALADDTSVPAGHQGAFVTVVTQDGVKAAVAHKVNDHWTVSAYVDHPWTGGLNEGVKIHATW